jgi:hypothetical protein
MLIWDKSSTNKKAIFIYNGKKIVLLETYLLKNKWVVSNNTLFHNLLNKSEYDSFEQVENAFYLHMRNFITQLILGLKTL